MADQPSVFDDILKSAPASPQAPATPASASPRSAFDDLLDAAPPAKAARPTPQSIAPQIPPSLREAAGSNWKPGDELPETVDQGDVTGYWDTPDQLRTAQQYNRELQSWRQANSQPDRNPSDDVDAMRAQMTHPQAPLASSPQGQGAILDYLGSPQVRNKQAAIDATTHRQPERIIPVLPPQPRPLTPSTAPQPAAQILAEEPPAPRPDHSTPDTAIMLNAAGPDPERAGIPSAPVVGRTIRDKNGAAQALLDVRDLLLGPAYGAPLKADSRAEQLVNGLLRATAGFSTPEGIAQMFIGAGIATKLPELVNSANFAAAVADHPTLAKGIDIAARNAVSGTVTAMSTVGASKNLYEGIKTGNLEQVGQGLADLAIGAVAGAHTVRGAREISRLYPSTPAEPTGGAEIGGSAPGGAAGQMAEEAATAQQRAEGLRQAGMNLPAEQWIRQAQATREAIPPATFIVNGEPHAVRVVQHVDGQPVMEMRGPDGEVVFTGSAKELDNFVKGMAAASRKPVMAQIAAPEGPAAEEPATPTAPAPAAPGPDASPDDILAAAPPAPDTARMAEEAGGKPVGLPPTMPPGSPNEPAPEKPVDYGAIAQQSGGTQVGEPSRALPIPASTPSAAMDPQETRARESALSQLRADPDQHLARYTAEFGNVLNADNAAKLFDEYNQDPAKYRAAVHPAAAWVRDELFRRALQQQAASPDDNRVTFTAGGNGAGKSTAISFINATGDSQAVLDSTFSNPDHARGLVQQALDAGKAVDILYVRRPLDEAFQGMLDRAGQEGRVVSIPQMIASDKGAAATVRELQGEFADDPRLTFHYIDNSGAQPGRSTIELTAPQDYTETQGQLHELLDAKYQAGEISEADYRRIRGDKDSGAPPPRRSGGGPGGGGSPQTGPGETPDGSAPEVAPPQSSSASPSRPDHEPQGKPAEVFTTAGRKVDTAYDVSEADDLVNSFEPDYPGKFQPRDTSRIGSRQRVDQRKADMNPPLMAESRLASDGAPITKNRVVITRNHGTQALKELYRENSPKAQQYREWLIQHAADYGLDPVRVSAMKQPILHRAITSQPSDSELVDFSREANMSSAARMSDAEMADLLAKRMTGPVMDSFEPTEDGRPNVEFVRALIDGLPVEEQSVFQDKAGQISQTGARLIRNAIFAKAYPDARAIERMAESESPSLKNITTGMLMAAPNVAKFEEAVRRGDAFPVGIGREIADAAAVIDELLRTNTPVAVWLDQATLYGRDPLVESLVRSLAKLNRSGRKIGELLKEYYGVADDAGSPKQEGLFGPPAPPEKNDVFAAALKRAEERWQPQADVLAQPESQNEPQSSGVAPGAGAPAGSGSPAAESQPENPTGVEPTNPEHAVKPGDRVRWTDYNGQQSEGEVLRVLPPKEGVGRGLEIRRDIPFPTGPNAYINESDLLQVLPSPDAGGPATGDRRLLNRISQAIDSGENIKLSLEKLAGEAYGGTRAAGAFDKQHIYEIQEAAINRWLKQNGVRLLSMEPKAALAEIRGLMDRMASQTVRSGEKVKLQQFSTPPTEAWLADKLAAVTSADSVLEPSGGIGGLVAMVADTAKSVHLNEISAQRAALAAEVGLTSQSAVDGETINALLPATVQPTVVIMNPPFSAGTVKSNEAKNSNKYGFNHVLSAMQRLAQNGRAVIILGGGRPGMEHVEGAALDVPNAWKFWNEIGRKYNIRANVGISGKEYAKYGTTFGTRLIVIDKDGPTPGEGTLAKRKHIVQGNFERIEDAWDALESVAGERPALGKDGGAVRPEVGGAGVAGTPGGVQQRPGGQPGDGQSPVQPGRGGPGSASAGADAQVPPQRAPEPNSGGEPVLQLPPRTEVPAAPNGESNPQSGNDLAGLGGISEDDIIQAAAQQLGQQQPASKPQAVPRPAPPRAPKAAKPPKAPTPTSAPPSARPPANAASTAADAARKRLEEKRKLAQGPAPLQSRAPENPVDRQDLIDLATIGAEHLLNGQPDYPTWSQRFLADAGELVRFVAEQSGISAEQILPQVHKWATAVAKQLQPDPPPQEKPDPPARVAIEKRERENAREDAGAFVTYEPVLAGNPHTAEIVESKAMSTVSLPPLTYQPELPADVKISNLQLESVVLAGQQNDRRNPDGSRGAVLIGDGTGVGKGRTAAAMILDNWNQGRKRIIWFSENWRLIADAIRDEKGIGSEELANTVAPLNKFHKTGKPIDHKGVVFSTYDLARSKDSKGNKVISLIQDYLKGEDEAEGAFIVFDEAHEMKNTVAGGRAKPSQTGQVMLELRKSLPNLRMAFLSATSATDVVNMGYLERLGLWGPKTPFPQGFAQFVSQIGEGGVAAMELIAQELKAEGKYIARTLSYRGVDYKVHPVPLNEDQKGIYREAAKAFQFVTNAVQETVQTINGGGKAKGAFMQQYWGAQQRFFNLLLTALKTPAAIEMAEQALRDGKAAVITLTNTNEAAQKRQEEKVKNVEGDEDENDDLDFGPKDILLDLIRQHYPIQQWVDDVDEEGKPVKRPLYTKDPETGKEVPVINPTAVKERDTLIDHLKSTLHVPENPLDIIINHFGRDKVAELTGRTKYYDSSTGKFVNRGGSIPRKQLNIVEAERFQNGDKLVAILSQAAGTGISLHADNNAPNQRVRMHITLQPGWSADKAMQMLGRTHRTNQKQPPEYVTLVSDLAGEKRFVSTIAKRMASLGALTRGSADASGGGQGMDKVNFDSRQGRQASNAFCDSLLLNRDIPGTNLKGLSVLQSMGMLVTNPQTGEIYVREPENVNRLLNRFLSLDPNLQNAVFDYFYNIFEAAVQKAMEDGSLDTGAKELQGDRVTIKDKQPLSVDPETHATTYYYPVDVESKYELTSPELLEKAVRKHPDGEFYVNKNTGEIFYGIEAEPIVHADGKTEAALRIITPTSRRWFKTKKPGQYGAIVPLAAHLTQEAQDAEAEVRQAQRDLQFASGQVQGIESSLKRYGFINKWEEAELVRNRERMAKAQEQVTAAEQKTAAAKASADNPVSAATARWKQKFEATPKTFTDQYHMIGGAVLRHWALLRANMSFMQGGAIRLATDSKTGDRVVGAVIRDDKVQHVLAQIRGGRVLVTPEQLSTDVIDNGTEYQLEGGIRIRRGAISRQPVVQLMVPDKHTGKVLRGFGVRYETGIQPIYYIPSGKTGLPIIQHLLAQYPIAPDKPAALQSRSLPGDQPLFNPEEEADSQEARQQHEDRLLGDQLTAQIKSGMAARPPKIKPAKQRGMFDEEEGPEQTSLFSRSLKTSPEMFRRVGETPGGGKGIFVDKGKVIDLGTDLHAQRAEKFLPGTLFGDAVQAMLKSGAVRARGEEIELYDRALGSDNLLPAVEHAVGEARRKRASDIGLEVHSADGGRSYLRVPLTDIGDFLSHPQRYVRQFGNLQQPTSLFSRAIPGFYSQLERTIEQKMPARALPQQITAIITNPQNGVKPDEVKWTGLDDFLKEQKGPVTREKVLEYLRANQVNVREVEKGRGVVSPEVQDLQERIGQVRARVATAQRQAESASGAVKEGDRIATVGSAASRGGYSYSTGKIYEAHRNEHGILVWKKVGDFGGERSGRSDKFVRELRAITPSMRDSVMQGQPLFARRRSVSPDQLELFDSRATTTEALKQPQPARKPGAFTLDPKSVRRLSDPGYPSSAQPTLGELTRYWDGAKVYARKFGNVPALVVNAPAMDVVLHRMGQIGAGESSNYTIGVTLGPSEWTNILREARATAQKPHPDRLGFDEALIDVGNQIAKALGLPIHFEMNSEANPLPLFEHPRDIEVPSRPPLVVVQAGPRVTDLVLKRVAEEEYDHAQQMALPTGLRGLPVHIVETPEGQKAAEALGSIGYRKLNPKSPFYAHNRAVMAAEIGVRLMRPDRWQELNLTAQEARTLAEAYVKGLVDRHGDKADAIVNQIYESVLQGETANPQGTGTVQGQHARPGEVAPAGGRGSPAVEAGPDVPGDQPGIVAGREPGKEVDSPFGPVTRAFAGNPKEALAWVRKERAGFAAEAIQHPELGPIGLPYGVPGERGYGVAHIDSQRGGSEYLDQNIEKIGSLPVVQRFKDETGRDVAAVLFDGVHRAVVSHDWKGKPAENWLLTAYDRPAPGTSVSVPGAPEGAGPTPPATGGRGPLAPTKRIVGEAPASSGPTPPETIGAPSTNIAPESGEVKNPPRDFLGDETGTSSVGAAARRAFNYATRNQHRPLEPAVSYAGLGAQKDKFVRNLSQLQKAHPGLHAEAVKAATSRAQTAALVRAAVPRIVEALGKSGPSWLDFRRALVESRLRGIRERWQGMAEGAVESTDEDLHDAFGSWLAPVLKAIHEESIGVPTESPAVTAAALLERQDFDGLRAFLDEAFTRAAERVAEMMPESEYQSITGNAGFGRGLDVYKRLLEEPVARNHEENEGVFSDALGPLDTYYPLVRLETDEDQARKSSVGRSGRAVPYRKPRNIANMFATGHGESYDPSMEAFNDRIRNAFRVNNKAALIEALHEAGVLQKVKRGENTPETVTWRGVEYRAVAIEIQPDRQLITPNGVVHIGQQTAVIPAWLEEELRPILDKRHLNLSDPKRLTGRINKFTLAGPLDAVIHSANLIGTLVANTPFLGKSLAAKSVGNLPFTKRAAAILHLINTDPSDEEAAKDIADMARLGVIPEKYGAVASVWFKKSREFAEQTGATLEYGFGPFLYGPRGIDIRARLLMYRTAKAINPGATPKELYLFVNQLGNYTRALQGKIERSLKQSGWSPFYTAGSTMVRNGVNAWTGQGPMPTGGKGGRLQRALAAITGGAVGLVALWLLSHKEYTGKWPWEDPHSKFLAVRLNPKDRASWLAQQLWGPASNGDAYIDLGFFSPLVKRGARALGISGMFDAHQAGASADQMMDAAVSGAVDAAIQPVFGPPAKAAWVGLSGTEPYVTGLRDDRGKPMFQFMGAVEKQKPGAAGWAKQHLLAPVVTMNSFLANLGAATGLTKGVIAHADDPENHWLRMAVDLATPQLFSHPTETLTHAEFLARQRAALQDIDRQQAKNRISDAIRDHNLENARTLAQKALKDGTISPEDVRKSIQRARVPKDIAGFKSLPVDAALEVLNHATPEEKQRFLPVLAQKLRQEFAHLPAQDRQRVLDQLRSLQITAAEMRAASGQ